MSRQIGLRDIHIAVLKTDDATATTYDPPTVALGFKSKKNTGKYRFVWLLKGKFELATDEYDTEGEKPKAQSAKLKGKFFSRESDGNYRFIADEDVQGVDVTIISAWFTEVPDEPVGV